MAAVAAASQLLALVEMVAAALVAMLHQLQVQLTRAAVVVGLVIVR